MVGGIDELVNLQQAKIEQLRLPALQPFDIKIDVLRLDKIHPVISGNKWFKLKYALEDAIAQNKSSIVTIGGAYSNHLVATAAACRILGLHSVGIVRGEEPAQLSRSLQQAKNDGMEICFYQRGYFQKMEELYLKLKIAYPDSYLIEEGGRGVNGVKGASEIAYLIAENKYDYLCCALGTGTTMAGLLKTALPWQKVVGVSALKIKPTENDLMKFIEAASGKKNFHIASGYHFGGYAKRPAELLHFMNEFFINTAIPSDFVYTAKLFYGVIELAQSGYFTKGAKLMVIHSGGLQGNCSLPEGALLF